MVVSSQFLEKRGVALMRCNRGSKMNSKYLQHWVTVAANVGVLIGLIFLVLEMRQNSAIATAQARLDYATGWREVDGVRQDPEFAAILAKSFEEPENLSFTEVIQLDAYYWGVVDQMISAQVGAESGVRERPFQTAANEAAEMHFSNEFARAWWRQVRWHWEDGGPDDFRQTMEQAIEAAEAKGIDVVYENLRKELGEVEPQVSEEVGGVTSSPHHRDPDQFPSRPRSVISSFANPHGLIRSKGERSPSTLRAMP